MRSPEAALSGTAEPVFGRDTKPAYARGPTFRAVRKVMHMSVLGFVYAGLPAGRGSAAIGAKWAVRAIAKDKLR